MFSRIKNETHTSVGTSPLHVLNITDIPFDVKRLYWISGMAMGEKRGFHAHKRLNQIFCVTQGSVNLKLYRGSVEYSFNLSSDEAHLFIPFGTWREFYPISHGTTIMVVADLEYDEEDYIRDWSEYLHWYSQNIREC